MTLLAGFPTCGETLELGDVQAIMIGRAAGSAHARVLDEVPPVALVARPLRVGERAPDFDAPDGEGTRWSSGALRGRAFVLYFYPKDETPGCIAEACAYRDEHEAFRALDVLVLGVSRDDEASHRAFAANRRLPFPLLCDADGAIHEAFGATMMGGLPRRVSYLVDAGGAVAAVFDSHLRPAAHAEKMLEAARAIARP